MSISMAKKFFGSPLKIQHLLVKAIQSKRAQRHLTQDELDAQCHFAPLGLPKCKDFEASPKLMSRTVFSLASCVLGIRADDVLRVRLSARDLRWVVKHMTKSKARLSAYSGGGIDEPAVSMEDAAPVYVIIKALEAMDPRHPAK